MAFTYLPAIFHTSIHATEPYILPGPVQPPQFTRQHDLKRFKIPLVDGGRQHGASANGWQISINGVITTTYSQTGTPTVLADEDAQFGELETLENNINRIHEQKYEFFLFFTTGGPYRKIKCCNTVNFTFTADNYTYPYSLTIVSAEADFVSTAPGS